MAKAKNNFFKKFVLPILNLKGLNTYFIQVLKNQYADFNGRCSRKQFWSFFLFFSIFYIFCASIDIFTMQDRALSLIFSVCVLVPGVAIIVRRMHDTGKSCYWAFIGLIPAIGNVALLFMLCLGSEVSTNNWGEPQEPFDNQSLKKISQNS